jgi:regulatory protein
MSIVTAIKRKKHPDSRFSIYLDNKYAFDLSDLDLSISGLYVGQFLEAEDIALFQSRMERTKAYNLALRFLSFRIRSRQEVVEYLRRKGVGTEVVEAAVQRLSENGLLNDREFALSWVRSRMSLKQRSRRVLEQELRTKGVSGEDIGAALEEVDPEAELNLLTQLADRKRRLPQYRQKDQLMGYLSRKGYSYDLIKKALERLDDEEVVPG